MTQSKKRKIGFEPTEAYTMQRLKKALRLYQRSRPRIEKRGLSHSYLGSFLRSSYYDLRIRSSNLEPIDVDCDDDDNDGNYIPSPRKKRKRNSSSKTAPSLPEQIEPKKLVVVLCLKSIPAKTFLHRLAHSAIFSDLVEESDHMEEKKLTSQVEKTSQAPFRNIQTCFAHPLDCELDKSNSRPCEFCTNFTFGMFGLGLKDVRVTDHGRGFGLEEIEGGHRSAGHERTRICHVCCLDRQYITNCIGHSLSAIPGIDPQTFDFQEAFQSLAKKPNGTYEQINLWCALCLNPVFFRCETIQYVDKFARDIQDNIQLGCGLLVCDGCKALFDKHENDLVKVVSSIPASEGLRADVEFLLPGSELQRYFSE